MRIDLHILKRIKTNIYLYIILLLLLISNIIFYIHGWGARTKFGFINIPEVYSNFKMKQEMESQFALIEKQRERILTKLQSRVRKPGKQTDNKDIKDSSISEQDFLSKLDKIKDDNKRIADNFSKKVLDQLNTYVKEYCEKNHYTAIFGADGSGTMMAADESTNVTHDVISYINERYKTNGGNKDDAN